LLFISMGTGRHGLNSREEVAEKSGEKRWRAWSLLFISMGTGRHGLNSREEVAEKSGEKRWRVWRGGKWQYTKLAPKRSIFGV